MKTKTFTQEQIREQIAEFLKDCDEDTFMTITRICFGECNPEFLKDKDGREFRLISMED